eukprot:483605_1
MEVLFGRQTLLIHGYGREISDKEDIFIPVDVIRLLLKFFNQIFFWNINDKNWNDLFSTKNGKAYYSELFDVNNIKFRCSLCPDGWKSSQKGKVQFYLEPKSFDDNIASFTVFYQLFCAQTKTNWKNVRKFTEKNQATSWYSSTLPRSEVSNVKDKKLDFYCYVDVLYIEYKRMQSMKRNYNKMVSMKTKCEYKWNLDQSTLIKCKNAINDQPFFSPSFGGYIHGNWCMTFIPKRECGWFELRLLRLPTKLKQIDINCKIVCYLNGLDFVLMDSLMTMNYEEHKVLTYPIYYDVIHSGINKLSFKIDIKVINGKKWNGNFVKINNNRDWVFVK